jgi:hypothetical protein
VSNGISQFSNLAALALIEAVQVEVEQATVRTRIFVMIEQPIIHVASGASLSKLLPWLQGKGLVIVRHCVRFISFCFPPPTA